MPVVTRSQSMNRTITAANNEAQFLYPAKKGQVKLWFKNYLKNKLMLNSELVEAATKMNKELEELSVFSQEYEVLRNKYRNQKYDIYRLVTEILYTGALYCEEMYNETSLENANKLTRSIYDKAIEISTDFYKIDGKNMNVIPPVTAEEKHVVNSMLKTCDDIKSQLRVVLEKYDPTFEFDSDIKCRLRSYRRVPVSYLDMEFNVTQSEFTLQEMLPGLRVDLADKDYEVENEEDLEQEAADIEDDEAYYTYVEEEVDE